METKVFRDDRGFLFESFNQADFNSATGDTYCFVQDNYSSSKKGVLRGIHYQTSKQQGKLIRVTHGAAFDVVVDIRKHSSSYKEWFGVVLSDTNNLQLWIPPGYAHGFLALSERTDVLYKMTDYYCPPEEKCVIWDDEDIGIKWPLDEFGIDRPIVSKKDQAGSRLFTL